MRAVRFLFLALAFGLPPVGAQPMAPEAVPPALRPWIPWALDGHPEHVCPVASGNAVCLWPGRLALELREDGGRFSLEALTDREMDVPLPGAAKAWPQGVTLDGRAAVVLEKGGRPTVRVGAGRHTFAGRFQWKPLPDTLAVPPALGLVDLTVNGAAVPQPKREAQGLLLLKAQGAAAATASENVTVKVFRRLVDGIPLWLDTRIVLEVSGKAREVALVGALVPSATPVAVEGDVPARLGPDGVLRVQVRPGRFIVRLSLRLAGTPAAVTLGPSAPPWPAREPWVFAADERLRQVQVGGAVAIDAGQTEIPDDWKKLPAFVLERATKLTLQETRRGEPEPAPDQLMLHRTLWLDMSGQSFSVRDQLTGTLGRGTRLELLAPGDLGRVSVGGADQLITVGTAGGGVELRDADLRLEADSRLPRASTLPAVGWNAGVQSLHAELRLPPGWGLVAAFGADEAPQTWLGRWGLFDLLLVLVTTALVVRLFGARVGLVAAIALFLTFPEPDAPRLLWLLLLGATVLARAVPAGDKARAVRLAWAGAFVFVLLAAVPFSIEQLRVALFPQAGPGSGGPLGELMDITPTPHRQSARAMAAPVVNAPVPVYKAQKVATPPPPPPVPEVVVPQSVEEMADEGIEGGVAGGVEGGVAGGVVGGVVGGLPNDQELLAKRAAELKRDASGARTNSYSVSSSARTVKAYEQDPHAVIQTGAGVPRWTWTSYSIGWAGPVDENQTLRLVLLSPWMNALLGLVRVLLVAWLLLRLAAERWRDRLSPRLLPFVLAMLVSLLVPAGASAQSAEGTVPGAAMLDELGRRLTRPPACAPYCVTTAQLQLSIAGGTLHMAAEVHAGAASAWAIPGPAESWVPRTVTLDGQRAEPSLARLSDGFLHLRLAAGVHQVVVEGPLPPSDSLTLQLPQPPRYASATSAREGASAPWQIDGIREDGSVDGSIQLTRVLRPGARGAEGGAYEPWLQVTRVVDIGLAWRVDTIVSRVSPIGAPVLVKVPLLKGMQVTDADREVKNGEVVVTLARDETATSWTATLAETDGAALPLEAPVGKPWSEVWIVRCGLVWQCEAAGLVPVSRRVPAGAAGAGRLQAEYRPWPGETLSLIMRRPQGQPGASLTVDAAHLEATQGRRVQDGSLMVEARASRSSGLALRVPEGTELRTVTVDGIAKPNRPEAGVLKLNVDAGAHTVRLDWRVSREPALLMRAPAVELGQPAANVEAVLHPGGERWLLAVGGTPWKPVVLFWGTLLLWLIAAALLSLVPGQPLPRREWLLLAGGIALTPIPFAAALVVFAWFLVLGWRKSRTLARPWVHNVLQLALAFFTLVVALLLVIAIGQALQGAPPDDVAGAGSTASSLRFYADRSEGAMPAAWVLSVPTWVYRALMLAWVLWLLLAAVRWFRGAWTIFAGAGLWKASARTPKVAAGAASASDVGPAEF
jgi:hypothetical protein